MIVTAPTLARPVDTAAFTDITTKQCLSVGWVDGQVAVQFAVDLTAAEQAAVKRRCVTGSPNEETVVAGAEQTLNALRAYVATPVPTAAQTTAAVKLLCQVAVGLARLVLRRFEGTD